MVVGNRPTTNVGDIRLIHAWRQAGSQTILWAQDMETMRPLHLVQWGDKVYLPVTEGLRLGIGLYNGSAGWMGYPTYIEAKNLYDNGPSQPNDCTSDDMWEVQPYTKFVMDALKNRDHQTGRPLVIVANGLGMGIGEATFGTDEFRGQIRVYERSADPNTIPRSRSASPLQDFGGYRGGFAMRGGGGLESFGYGEEITRSASPTRGVTRGVPSVGTDHQVGIGAGAEERRESIETGVRYFRNSRLVAALNVESRADLSEVLRAARHTVPEWCWTPNGTRWFATWAPTEPVSPHIPVASPAPHQPQGTNRGGAY